MSPVTHPDLRAGRQAWAPAAWRRERQPRAARQAARQGVWEAWCAWHRDRDGGGHPRLGRPHGDPGARRRRTTEVGTGEALAQLSSTPPTTSGRRRACGGPGVCCSAGSASAAVRFQAKLAASGKPIALMDGPVEPPLPLVLKWGRLMERTGAGRCCHRLSPLQQRCRDRWGAPRRVSAAPRFSRPAAAQPYFATTPSAGPAAPQPVAQLVLIKGARRQPLAPPAVPRLPPRRPRRREPGLGVLRCTPRPAAS